MAFSNKLLGNNRENIPNWAFLLMALVMKVIDIMGSSTHRAVLSNGYSCPVDDHTADVVLAFGMFHIIQNTNALLRIFSKIVRFSDVVIIEDGHQVMRTNKAKILKSGYFKIESKMTGHVQCLPL